MKISTYLKYTDKLKRLSVNWLMLAVVVVCAVVPLQIICDSVSCVCESCVCESCSCELDGHFMPLTNNNSNSDCPQNMLNQFETNPCDCICADLSLPVANNSTSLSLSVEVERLFDNLKNQSAECFTQQLSYLSDLSAGNNNADSAYSKFFNYTFARLTIQLHLFLGVLQN